MPIAELFLGAFLQVLFDRLASRELLNFARREGIDTQLKEWKKMLESIKEVLDDAEDRQLTGHLEVNSWLEDLRNLAYDIEDLLDEFTTEAAESKSKAKPSTSKVRSLLPSCCLGLSPRALMFDHEMRSEIEKMDDRLQKIIARKDGLSLRENKGKRSAYRQLDKPIPTTNLPERWFVSREDDKKEILKFLTQKEDGGTCVDLEVIAIVGMGGVGKTALAQQVYNDAWVTAYFDVKAWACISDEFDMLTITKSILQKSNFTLSCEDKDLDWLQDKLKENLSSKKFLVVLDDIWNKNSGKWNKFLKPFRSGAKGSKIIVTTRDSGIAKISLAKEYPLKELSQDACMSLLAFHAFGVGNFDHHRNFEALGWKIVEKCKGLPLAVTTLGGLLSSKDRHHEWEDVLNNKIWDLPKESDDILPALKLSYLHLPCNLRRCFAYCAIFPKDCEIQRHELIHWWFAEGLLEGEKQESHWNAGLSCFNELVSRSLFQKSTNESQFFMHDLVNDLAKLVAGATYFDLGEPKVDRNNASLARYASFIHSECILPEKFKIYHGMKGLRSFISLDKTSRYYSWVSVSQKVLYDLLSTFKYLRVLSLSQYNITEVPESIGKLRHLRHLNLSYTCIRMLPKSIVALYNLKALMLQGCHDLLELPKGIEKLINLRFLDITDTPRLKAMPLHVGNLVGLEMLSKFIVEIGNGSRLKELKNLENLRGELCISDLHKVQEVEDANDANLCTKKGICRLTIKWSIDFEISRNIELEGKVFNFLRPHKNLENLTISYYGGLEFPSWLGSPSCVNIVCLHIHGCRRVKALPLLGHLPSLEELYIKGLNSMCTIRSEFYGSTNHFPSLLTLEFKDMPVWRDWSHCIDIEEFGVVFPRLDRLVIQDCPKLKALPSFISLPSLNELEFKDCNVGVLQSLVSSASLTALTINDVVELTCLNHGFTSSLIKLEKLEIVRCTKLIYLWQDGDVIRNFDCLKRLVVRSCPEFIYFVVEEGDIELPSNLETIHLNDCIKLEKLPSKMHTLYSLRDLSIENCPNLMSFPETGIPTSMISLQISNCNRLQHLPRGLNADPDELGSINTQGDKMSCLQSLMIYCCNSLPAALFSEGVFLPMTLKKLNISNCQNMESLAQINLDCLQSLQEIHISNCHKLRSLPQGLNTLSGLNSLDLYKCTAIELECFPHLPPGISRFSLSECPKIKSLPNQLHRLTCLRDLSIIECESITCFPDGGLPPQLQELRVWGCGDMKEPVREWLSPLTSLEWLEIDGRVGGVGEQEDLVLPLPSSLLCLTISNMEKMERLSNSLPPSLQKLWIFGCPKLRELPQDGLPPSLQRIFIAYCPILKKRCKKGTGCYWPLICEIPCIDIID